ncbi:MAG TPA: hypothetical protein VI566_04750 [Xanthomonadales bacterium]|nr:hypothetical protein [Xanthomonadales bacterium]
MSYPPTRGSSIAASPAARRLLKLDPPVNVMPDYESQNQDMVCIWNP